MAVPILTELPCAHHHEVPTCVRSVSQSTCTAMPSLRYPQIAASLTWAKCSATAATVSALVTTPLAIMTWLITAAKLNDGVINLDTTGQDYPMLAGNLVALFFSMILCIVLSYIWPQVRSFVAPASVVAVAAACCSIGGRRKHAHVPRPALMHGAWPTQGYMRTWLAWHTAVCLTAVPHTFQLSQSETVLLLAADFLPTAAHRAAWCVSPAH